MTDTESVALLRAYDALYNLLEELPAEFKYNPDMVTGRDSFTVIKRRNVRKVHEALWELQDYFNFSDLD